MKKQIIRRSAGLLLAAALAMSPAAAPGQAAHGAAIPRDVKGHWAQQYITEAMNDGIVAGYTDGTFQPERAVSRAEFSHMLNKALGNGGSESLSFKDVKRGEWYYDDVSKAVAAGFVSGYSDSTFRPDLSISRQEAAAMLALVTPTAGSGASLSKYSDSGRVESWAKPSMEFMVGKGYLGTYLDGGLHPLDTMTRAQAATIIVKMMNQEKIIKTDPNITQNGTRLSNAIYSNGVTISRSLDNGEASLTGCVVLGTLDVQGGGTNTVTLTDCRVARASVQKSSGAVRLLVNGQTTIKNTSAANTATLESGSLSGSGAFGAGFQKVAVAQNANITLRGTFPSVDVEGSSADVRLTSGRIDTLNVGSSARLSDITVDGSASVTQTNVSAESFFHGSGSISRMNASANGITYEKKPGTVSTSGSLSKPPVLSETGLSITPDPKSGATNVAIDKKITLTFNRAITLYGGSSIAASDIKKFVQLREKTSSGSKVAFTGSINSAKTVITITPTDNLDIDKKYYLVIDKNELKDSKDNKNDAFSTYFTTGSDFDGYTSFSPKNGATGVSLSANLTVRFSEKMINYDGSTISGSDLSSIITLRKNNSSGTKVPYSASIDSAKKVITIDPDSKLEAGTKYYLALNSKSVKTSADKKAVPAASVTFTTVKSEASDYCTFSPGGSSSGVSATVHPTLTFTEKMVCYDRSEISTSDIYNDIVIFRNETQGKDVDYTATINSAKTKITITPKSALIPGCKYTLGFRAKSLRTAKNYDAVPAASISFTVSGTLPAVSLTAGSNEDTITISASGTVAGNVYAVLLPDGAATPSDAQILSGKDAGGNPALNSINASVAANTAKQIGKFTDLKHNTSYKVCAVLDPSSSSYPNSPVVWKSVSTSGAPASVLSQLYVECGGKKYSAALSASKTEYSIELPFGSEEATICAATSGGNTAINRNGQLTSGTVSETVALSGTTNSYKIISNKSGSTDTEYTLTIKVKGNTALKAVIAGGESLRASGGVYKFEIPAKTSKVDVVIETIDPQASISVKTFSKIGTGSLSLSFAEAQSVDFTITSNGESDTYSLNISKEESVTPPPEEPDPNPGDKGEDGGDGSGTGDKEKPGDTGDTGGGANNGDSSGSAGQGGEKTGGEASAPPETPSPDTGGAN